MLPSSLATLHQLWAETGRTGRPEISIGLPVDTVDDVKRMAAVGVDRLILSPWRRTSDALDGIARFAGEIVGGCESHIRFNARARSGRQYRILFQAYAQAAISPAAIPEGATSTGKIYFDCNGSPPAMVVYNDGAQDLLTWQ